MEDYEKFNPEAPRVKTALARLYIFRWPFSLVSESQERAGKPVIKARGARARSQTRTYSRSNLRMYVKKQTLALQQPVRGRLHIIVAREERREGAVPVEAHRH